MTTPFEFLSYVTSLMAKGVPSLNDSLVLSEENSRRYLEAVQEKLSCGICKEVCIGIVVLWCGHPFCKNCLTTKFWKTYEKNCPTCGAFDSDAKTPFTGRYVVALDFIVDSVFGMQEDEEVKDKRDQAKDKHEFEFLRRMHFCDKEPKRDERVLHLPNVEFEDYLERQTKKALYRLNGGEHVDEGTAVKEPENAEIEAVKMSSEEKSAGLAKIEEEEPTELTQFECLRICTSEDEENGNIFSRKCAAEGNVEATKPRQKKCVWEFIETRQTLPRLKGGVHEDVRTAGIKARNAEIEGVKTSSKQKTALWYKMGEYEPAETTCFDYIKSCTSEDEGNENIFSYEPAAGADV